VFREKTGWLVVGLGNPGSEYAGSRHNAGFLVCEELARRSERGFRWRKKMDGALATASVGGKDVWLLRPMTYMNLSGRCVGQVSRYLKVPLERLLVIHDEVDLEFGRLQVKQGGGDAGHRGIESVIGAVGQDFTRIRVGVGRPPGDAADYVLDSFSRFEREQLRDVIGGAADAAETVVVDGVTAAMNRFNVRRRDA